MHEISMTVRAFLFIPRHGVQGASMGKHGSALIRHGKQVSVAFEALVVFDAFIGFFPLFLADVIVTSGSHVDGYVFEAMPCFGEKEIDGIVGRGQMTVHTVGYKSLPIIDMGGGLPGLNRGFDFMTACAKFRRGGSDHGVVGHAEYREGNKQAEHCPEKWRKVFFSHRCSRR
jgi:hypothetical protein